MKTKKLKSDYSELDSLSGQTLTQEQKDRILEISDSYNIPRPKNYQCPNCWEDLIIQTKIEIKNILNSKDKTKKYILRSNVDVIWKGIRINNDTLTDELAIQYIAKGFPIEFFIRHE